MTDDVYRWFVKRCLLLEREIAILKGYNEAPLLEDIERKSLYETAPAMPRKLPMGIVLPKRAKQRQVRAEDIAQMRRLRSSGMRPSQISSQVGFSESTVRAYTNQALLAREVRATHY